MPVEAAVIWNEPNNKSHWDFLIDKDWSIFAEMCKVSAAAIRAENPKLPIVLGGISPIDADFMRRLKSYGVLDAIDAVAVHGFPLDWNHWHINDWPNKIGEIRDVVGPEKPVWVTEVGVSSFGAEEVQEFGLRRTAELLVGRSPRIHWYSLFDLPKAWPATTRHKEAEGSAYYRHFYMGLIREDGEPKLACKHFHEFAPQMGLCQWVHFEDHRLDSMIRWMRELGVTYLRTGLSWADVYRPSAINWFDRQMKALEPFNTAVTYCFTPEHCGIEPHHTSPPKCVNEFADFCGRMTRRYAS